MTNRDRIRPSIAGVIRAAAAAKNAYLVEGKRELARALLLESIREAESAINFIDSSYDDDTLKIRPGVDWTQRNGRPLD